MSREFLNLDRINALIDRIRMQQLELGQTQHDQGQPRPPVLGWAVAPASPARIPLPLPPPIMLPPPPLPPRLPRGMNNLNTPRDSRPSPQNIPQPSLTVQNRPTAPVAPIAAHTIPRLVRQRRRGSFDSGARPVGSPAELLSHYYGSNVTNSFEIQDTAHNSSRTTAQEQEQEPSTSEESDPISPAERSSNHGLDHWTGSFKCPVCLDYLRQPVILPCGHTFCKTCVWRLVYHRAEEFRNVHPHNLFFFCPSCRKRVQAKNFARYSPVNVALSSAIEGYLNSDERKTALSRDNQDGKTGETQTSNSTVVPRESVSTQTESHHEPDEIQHLSVTNDDTATLRDIFVDTTQHITKTEYSLLRQQAQLAQGLGIAVGVSTENTGRATRSESAPPGSKTGGRTAGTSSRAMRTDGHVCFRDGNPHDAKKRRQEQYNEQDARHRTMIFIAVFVMSALIILDGCVSQAPERRDASPLQVAAWASLLSTTPTFIQCALKTCYSLVKLLLRR